jgi:ATP-dependent Clp protease ATP-binding subunit ClpB
MVPSYAVGAIYGQGAGSVAGCSSNAQEYSHQEIDGEHLMLALVDQPEGLIQPLLQRLGVPSPSVRADIERELQRRAKVQGTTSVDTSSGPI